MKVLKPLLLSLLLVVLLVAFSACGEKPAPEPAPDPTPEPESALTPSMPGILYSINEDGETCTIRGFVLTGTTCTDVVIGEKIDGYRITAIQPYAFENCTWLTSITIPANVTNFGDAFYNCKSLTSVTIDNGVTSIDNRAFYGCDRLTSVTIPNSVTSIGNSAFYGCDRLTSITYNGTKAEWEAIDKITWIGGDLVGFTKTCTIHCTDGDITITYKVQY